MRGCADAQRGRKAAQYEAMFGTSQINDRILEALRMDGGVPGALLPCGMANLQNSTHHQMG